MCCSRGGRESKPPRDEPGQGGGAGNPCPGSCGHRHVLQVHPARGCSRRDPVFTPLPFSRQRGLRPAPQSPLPPTTGPLHGASPGVGSGALGPVVIISKCSSRAMAGVSSSSWGHAAHTRRLLVLSVCAVSVRQSGDRTCPTPHVGSAAKQGTDLGCPGAAPAWPRRRPTILWRAEACPLSGICRGIIQGKLIRYKLFLIFQTLFEPRPVLKPAQQLGCRRCTALSSAQHPLRIAGARGLGEAVCQPRGSAPSLLPQTSPL